MSPLFIKNYIFLTIYFLSLKRDYIDIIFYISCNVDDFFSTVKCVFSSLSSMWRAPALFEKAHKKNKYRTACGIHARTQVSAHPRQDTGRFFAPPQGRGDGFTTQFRTAFLTVLHWAASLDRNLGSDASQGSDSRFSQISK